MKRVFYIGVLMVSACFFVGCGSSPQGVARSFSESLAKGKVTEAKKYATEQTGQILDMASSMGAIPVEPDARFIFVGETINGNKAVVRYRETADGAVQSMDLVKVDGEWKVHLTK